MSTERANSLKAESDDFIWKIARPLFFQFSAEKAHALASSLLYFGKFLPGSTPISVPTNCFGIPFLNPVGLAPGFDKNAEFVDCLPAFGFGFVEIGTVTPKPQPGNPKPRLFREKSSESLFNRMGFNNDGALEIAKRLESKRIRLPPNFRVGLNIGKNKTTSAEDAHKDYGIALKPFNGLVDYIVINVSSPNTPGLRDLQSPEALKRIVAEVQNEIATWSPRPPVLIKLSPELILDNDALLHSLIAQFESDGSVSVDGWVGNNTLMGQWQGESGGWSGGKITDHSSRALKALKSKTSKPLVSVGGILTVEEGLQRLNEGASLIQIYSGWIFRGPFFPRRLSETIRDRN